MAGRPQENVRSGPSYKLAEFLNAGWDKFVGGRSNDDVATSEFGYRQGNLISMWRTGKTRIPLEKLPDLSRVLKMDLGLLLPLWLEQYWGERSDSHALLKIMSDQIITANEVPLIQAVRKETKGLNALSPEKIDAIRAVLTDEPTMKSAAAMWKAREDGKVVVTTLPKIADKKSSAKKPARSKSTEVASA